MYSAPVLPPLDVPDEKTSLPLEPESPEFAVRMVIAPLDVDVPSPVAMARAPPVRDTDRPVAMLMPADPARAAAHRDGYQPTTACGSCARAHKDGPAVAALRCAGREDQHAAHTSRRARVRRADGDHPARRRRAFARGNAQGTTGVHSTSASGNVDAAADPARAAAHRETPAHSCPAQNVFISPGVQIRQPRESRGISSLP